MYFFADVMVGLVLLVVGLAALCCELLRIALFPLNWVNRRCLAKRRADVRRLVVFDGICVLCNRFGRFAHGRLVNTDLVTFVPFQDSLHVKVDDLQSEFAFDAEHVQKRIAFICGPKIFWGSDAILELCRWLDWPYPLARLAYIVPGPVRDALYTVVADNRYRWFGTQSLDKNFARQLCPYYYFKKPGKKQAAEGAAEIGLGRTSEGAAGGAAGAKKAE